MILNILKKAVLTGKHCLFLFNLKNLARNTYLLGLLFTFFYINDVYSAPFYSKDFSNEFSKKYTHNLSFTAAYSDVEFIETENSLRLNTETGYIISESVQYKYYFGDDFILMGANQSHGQLNYRGLTQSGRKRATQTLFRSENYKLALGINLKFINEYWHVPRQHQFFTVIGGQIHNTDRHIQTRGNISGLEEAYHYPSIDTAFYWHYQVVDTLKFQLKVNQGYAIKPSMKINFLTKYDTANLDLNKILHRKILIGLEYSWSNRIRILTQLSAENIVINKSDQQTVNINGASAGVFHQPRREKSINELSISFAYLF